MIRIIDRQDGQGIQKTKRSGLRSQISYNSDGHLVIRLINSQEFDSLVVLNEAVSRQVIEFCQNQLSLVRLKPKEDSDIPF